MGNNRCAGLAALSAVVLMVSGCVSDHGGSRGENHVSVNGSVLEGSWKGYVTVVPAGTTELVVELRNLSQDADLYVESPFGREACDSFATGTEPEMCVFFDPPPGEWYIEVAGWDYGRTYYTLTSSLRPSYKRASLWPVEQGVFSYQAKLATHEAVTEQSVSASEHLRLLKAAWQMAMTQTEAEVTYRVFAGEQQLGEARLHVGDTQGQRTVHVKAMVRDPVTGERSSVRTRARHPLVSGGVQAVPEQGMLSVRVGDALTSVRLGMDTGTSSDVQIVTEPGPVVDERSWSALTTGEIRLEAPAAVTRLPE